MPLGGMQRLVVKLIVWVSHGSLNLKQEIQIQIVWGFLSLFVCVCECLMENLGRTVMRFGEYDIDEEVVVGCLILSEIAVADKAWWPASRCHHCEAGNNASRDGG
jgi:hypothetical protein